MRSHEEVIEAFGGTAKLAEAIGVDPKLAIHWGRRGIPAKYWPNVEESEAGKRLGVTAKLLGKLRQWRSRGASMLVAAVA